MSESTECDGADERCDIERGGGVCEPTPTSSVFRNALILSDVLRSGGSWTIEEVMARCAVGNRQARHYLKEIEAHYPEVVTEDDGPVKVWRAEF